MGVASRLRVATSLLASSRGEFGTTEKDGASTAPAGSSALTPLTSGRASRTTPPAARTASAAAATPEPVEVTMTSTSGADGAAATGLSTDSAVPAARARASSPRVGIAVAVRRAVSMERPLRYGGRWPGVLASAGQRSGDLL
jgi:hypothetical protein